MSTEYVFIKIKINGFSFKTSKSAAQSFALTDLCFTKSRILYFSRNILVLEIMSFGDNSWINFPYFYIKCYVMIPHFCNEGLQHAFLLFLLLSAALCGLFTYLRSVTLGTGFGGPDFTGVALGEDCSVFEGGSGGGVFLPTENCKCCCLCKLSLS